MPRTVQVPGVRAMAEEFGLTCIQAHRMDSTRAVLRSGDGCRSRRQPGGGAADEASLATPAGKGTAEGSAAVQNGRCGCHGCSGPGANTASADNVAAAAVAASDCTHAAAAPSACTSAAAAAAGPAENAKQRAGRERKLAAIRARGLQPPPLLLGQPPEPSVRRASSISLVWIVEIGPSI